MLKNGAIFVLVTRSLLYLVAESCQECEVRIALSAGQEMRSYIPQRSVVVVNCTAENSLNPVWSIQLPGQNNPIQFTFEASIRRLNSLGFQELEAVDSGMVKIIQLLINTTMENNGTVVGCDNAASGMTIAQTTLEIVNETQLNLSATGSNLQAVVLLWIPGVLSMPIVETINETYTLTVMSNHTRPQIFHQIEPGYVYNAPKGAPPCALYNFSVTATYVGTMATYTGAGCNVYSEVLNIMLPSLPDISRMESSVDYVLEKRSTLGFELHVSFMPATYCESYPVTFYTLEVEGLSTVYESETNATSMIKNISIDNLLDDHVYNFSIFVSNSVGILSTSKTKFYTTDVQLVRAIPLEGNTTIMLQCMFVTGSDAIGCLVVLQLVGEADNITFNLTRKGNHNMCVMKAVNLTKSSMYTSKFFGYDIKSNGSIGTLPVPGEISWNVLNCSSSVNHIKKNTSSIIMVTVIVVVTTVVVTIFCALLSLPLTLLCYKLKRSQGRAKRVSRLSIKALLDPSPSSPDQVIGEVKSNSEQNTGHYELPIQNRNAASRIPGDGIDSNYYSDTQGHKSQGHDVNYNNTYAELGDVNKEHFYHVLECNRTPRGIDSEVILPDPDAPELSPPFKEESPAPPPIYQDISDVTAEGTAVRQNENYTLTAN